MFGSRLATVYAPQTLASFGSGAARIDVRVIAPDGAAAYRTALAADLRARRAAGLQLLADPRVSAQASARSQLAAGRVDERLLMTPGRTGRRRASAYHRVRRRRARLQLRHAAEDG